MLYRIAIASSLDVPSPSGPVVRRFVAVLLCILAACKPDPGARTTSSNQTDTQASSRSKDISDDAPLEDGHVVFRGMVRPTKGGHHVGGVIIGDGVLQKALAGAPGNDPKNADWFLGAVVRIEGELRKHAAPPPRGRDEPMEQTRNGSWLEATRVDSATIVKQADMIEGTLSRSKGFFVLAERLISREDLAWSLAPNGAREGDRVRLYGQPRTVPCEPNAQCLIEGSLPLFDVGRAERLP